MQNNSAGPTSAIAELVLSPLASVSPWEELRE